MESKKKTKTKEYVVSKEKCLERIKGRVCNYCGRQLQAIEAVDNSDRPTYWAGCMHNSKGFGDFTYGTTKEIYAMAREYIFRYGVFNYNRGISLRRYKYEQIAKAVEVIENVLGLKKKIRKESYRFKTWHEFSRITRPTSS